MKKFICIILVLLAERSSCSAQDMYLPPPPPNQLFSTTLEEYRRMKFEEKIKQDSERLVFEMQRIKVQAEMQRLYQSGSSKKVDQTAVSIEEGLEKLRKALNPETPTLRATASAAYLSNSSNNNTSSIEAGTVAYVDTNAAVAPLPEPSVQSYVQPPAEAIPINQKNFSRFANSPCFQTLGYIPNDPGLEERYRSCEESKRKDEMAKISLWIIMAVGAVSGIWYAFKAMTVDKRG